MKKIKYIIIVIFFIFSYNIYSQRETKLYFKDGSTSVEPCKRKGKGVKCTIKNKKVKYDFENILAIEELSKINEPRRFVYAKLTSGRNPILIEELIRGNVSLYERVKMNAPQVGGASYIYYVKKESERTYKKIGVYTFDKQKVRQYFTDCPLLIKRMENKFFTMKSPHTLVKFYNKNCGN